MNLPTILFLLLALQSYPQLIIPIGPIITKIQDPLAQGQEKRATTEDKKMLPKITAMAVEIQLVKKFVTDYEKSLGTINPFMKSKEMEINDFLDECINYIVAKNSIAANIPGLSKVAAKSRLISLFQTNKIRSLKTELKSVFKTDNYMTEAERKVLLLDLIDRALQLTI